jgi:predicted GH43/DUF377 family glycosyl hydrolase
MTAHNLLLHERSRQEQAKQIRGRKLFHIGRPVTVLSVALLAATAAMGSTINTMSYLDSISAALPVPTMHRVTARRSANTQTLALGSSVSSDSASRVLGTSVIAPAPSTEAQINVAAVTSTIASLVNNQLNQYLSQGLLTGPAGPPGASGLTPGFSGPNGMVQDGNGQTTSVIGGTPIVSYIPASQGYGNYTGGSLAGFTNLSAGTFASGNTTISGNLDVSGPVSASSLTSSGGATIAGAFSAATSTLSTLTVSGPATFNGSTTIAGLTVIGLNPGLTQGSIAIQGTSGLSQDNANLFYDATNHRLGLGTTTPSQLLTVAGNALVTGNATITGNQIISGTLNVAGTTTHATTTVTSFTASGPATLQSTLSVTATSTLATTTITNLTLSQALTVSSGGSGAMSLTGILRGNGTSAYTAIQGTAGYVTRWTDQNTLGTGILLDNGTVAGVNATSLTIALNVQGSSTLDPFQVASSNASSLLIVKANGNVGIGTSSPAYKVDVNGTLSAGMILSNADDQHRWFSNLPFGPFAIRETAVLDVGASGWDSGLVGDPWIMRKDNLYYMFYNGFDGVSHAGTGVATSTDLINWTKYSGNPVVSHGTPGSFDSSHAGKPAVIKIGGMYHLYYEGDNGTTRSIGHATSNDLLTWSKDVNPILTFGTEGNGDMTISLMAPSVFEHNGLIYMFYSGQAPGPDYRWRIYYATSSDGVTWTKVGLAFGTSSSGWDAGAMFPGSIIQVGNYYVMSYNAGSRQPVAPIDESDPTGQGMAFSTDLVNWTKYSGNPVIADAPTAYIGNVWRSHLVNMDGSFYIFLNASSNVNNVTAGGAKERIFIASPAFAQSTFPALSVAGNVGIGKRSSEALAPLDVFGSAYLSGPGVYGTPTINLPNAQQYIQLGDRGVLQSWPTEGIGGTFLNHNALYKTTTGWTNLLNAGTSLIQAGTDTIGFYTNGTPGAAGTTFTPTQRVWINDAGLGIGAASPGNTTPLYVTAPDVSIKIKRTTNGGSSGILYLPESSLSATTPQWYTGLANAGNSYMVQSWDGSANKTSFVILPNLAGVGIGGAMDRNTLSGAWYTLTSSLFNAGVAKFSGGTNSATYPVTLDLSNNSGTAQAGFSFPQGGAGQIAEAGTLGGTNDIIFQGIPHTSAGFVGIEGYNSAGLVLQTGGNTNPILFKINRSEKVRIDSSGNVGIGTTSPGSKLDIWGNLNVATGSNPTLFVNTATQNVGIGTSTPTLGPLTMASGAYVSSGGTWTNASDRNLKENFVTVTPADILQKIDELPVTEWDYKSEGPGVNHIGPVAQDFWAAFHLGNSSTSISTIDPAGVALLGIQALNQKIEALQGSLTGNAATTGELTVYNPGNFSGDSVGEAKILSGQTSVRITFTQPYAYQPIVTATPVGDSALADGFRFTLEGIDASGFTIQTLLPVTSDTTFDWHSFASPAARLTVSDGSTAPIALIVPPAAPSAPPFITDPATAGNSSSTPDSTASTTPASAAGSSTPPAVLGASTSTPPVAPSPSAPLTAPPPPPVTSQSSSPAPALSTPSDAAMSPD